MENWMNMGPFNRAILHNCVLEPMFLWLPMFVLRVVLLCAFYVYTHACVMCVSFVGFGSFMAFFTFVHAFVLSFLIHVRGSRFGALRFVRYTVGAKITFQIV